ncbi:helix-turn-helix transcriptional regulator [Tenacibaculum sp. 190524A02b]|uniref:HTH cro/C1-type domain-containing protein n=1 Tax=Tenacibaculum vairaonense TaxID=3137860 RepID=A0ABM9PQP9_9FLAO
MYQEKINKILLKIKEKRKELEMSQYEFGKKIGLSQNAYFKLETGKTKLDLFRFFIIAKVLGVSSRDLIGE